MKKITLLAFMMLVGAHAQENEKIHHVDVEISKSPESPTPSPTPISAQIIEESKKFLQKWLNTLAELVNSLKKEDCK